jgi:hypothetical protein
MTTLEQVMEAARALPIEERRLLRQWLEEQEREPEQWRQREEEVRQQSERFRRAMRWIDENRAQYMGQWVALDGDRLISHGQDARQVHLDAKAAGIESPFVERVMEEDNLPFCGGWMP